MPERNLQFEDVSVHQALGIRHGDGFKIEDLSGCINIIHGRNGSGKTTTSRVIQELLWPGKTDLERAAVSGTLREEERAWEVLVEPGHREWRLNGVPEAGPEIGPAENRHRYRLSLEELIAGEDQHFAEEISAATLGGFDLEEATRRCGFNQADPATHTAAAAREAEDKWIAVTEQHRALQQEELRSEQLKRDAAASKAAAERLPQLERTRDFRDACRKCDELRARLEAFPNEIGNLQGNEREELDRLHGLSADTDKARAETERRIANARGVQSETKADGETAEKICEDLKARLPQLQRLENSIEQERKAVSQAKGEAAELRKRLGKNFTEDQVGDLSSPQFPELSDFARQIISFIAEQRVNEERINALEDAAPKDLPGQSYEQLHDAIRSLREWLASAERTGTKGWLPFALSLFVLAAASAVMGVTQHPGWFAGLLVAGGLGAWDWAQRTGRNLANIRAVHQADYVRSGLPEPPEWTADLVSEQLRTLTDLTVKRRAEDDRLRDLTQLQAHEEQLKTQRDELEQRRQELSERLGPDVELSDEWLPRFIDNLTRWQEKCTAIAGHERTVADLGQQRDELIGQMNSGLAEVGLGECDSSEGASQSINALDARLARRRDALRDEADARRELKRIDTRSEEIAAETAKIHARVGVDAENEGKIDDWLNRRDDFLAAQSALREAEIVRDQRQGDLAGFDPVETEDIDALIAETMATAAKWESRRDEIAAIQARIENARTGRELSAALDAKDGATKALRDIHEQHLAQAAGNRLSEWVRIRTSQGTRPQVFKRAKELLRQFTNNRLQLDMDDRSVPPKFIAHRSEDSASPVTELSVGERMQLLVAVRLAFLELNENIRLPLLLDEVLGTSDDERAATIIDTVIAIAKDGRQVFYFTAQLDEVGKWVSRLNETSTQHRVIDLDHVRDTTATPARPIPATPVQLMPPPRPGGDDHLEYGRKLRITFFDPWDEASIRLHLWHVIDDVQLLYKMLRKQVTSWWQLQQLPEADREKLFPGSAGAIHKAEAVAKAIEIASRAWRVGRCQPVTRQVLFNSRVVSERYFEDVAKLAEQLEGDAERIIEGLNNRLISGWRRAKTNELRSYFSAHGFLVTNHPQKRTDIHRRVVSSLTDELENKLLSPERIDQIVNSLPDLD